MEIPTFDGHLDVKGITSKLSSLSHSKHKLEPIVIGGGLIDTDLASDDASVRKKGLIYLQGCIKNCSDIGGALVCGPLYTAVGNLAFLTEVKREKQYKNLSKEFKKIGKFAKDYGVKIALEPLCRYDTHLVNTSNQARKLVDLIDEENVGILLDTFHMNIEEKSMLDAISKAGDKLFHFHACENDRGTPGTGQINWNEVARGLDKVRYNGWISLESFVPFDPAFSSAMRVWRPLAKDQDEIARKGLEFMKKMFNH